MNVTIEAHGVGKHYGKTLALDGLDLAVEAGQVVAVLGPNGAGKTTFVRAVATLLRLDAGTLRVLGYDVRREPGAVRRLIGLAGQYAAVEPAMTGAREPRDGGSPLRTEATDGACECTARAGAARARRAGRPPGPHLFGRHASPTRPRCEPRGRAAPAAARRADDRTGSAQPDRALGRDPGARRGGHGRSADNAVPRRGRPSSRSRIVIVDHGRAIAYGTPAELKRRVGGRMIDVHAQRRDDLSTIAAALGRLGGGRVEVEEATRRVTVNVDAAGDGLVTALRSLEDCWRRDRRHRPASTESRRSLPRPDRANGNR